MSTLHDVSGYEQQLEKFRDRIQDVIPRLKHDFFRHDLHLLRFLVARDFDVSKAEEMLRKHVTWRENLNVDGLLEKRLPKHVRDASIIVFTGRDRNGYPVMWHRVGRWDLRTAVNQGWANEMAELIRQQLESLLEVCRRLSQTEGKYIGQYHAIIDMDGCDYTQYMSVDVIQRCRSITQEFQDQYPELPYRITVINAPRLFRIVRAIWEPMLNERTRSKIQLYGTDTDVWKSYLLEQIHPDNLPSPLGGAITTWKYLFSEDLPEVFQKPPTLEDDLFEKICMPAGQKHVILQQVEQGKTLCWNFRTDKGGIGFEATTMDGQVAAPYSRCDSHKVVQKGQVHCAVNRTCTLTFDNSFSKLTGKILYVAIMQF